MIDLNFYLFWSGSRLSYLRYLTFASLRKFHPHSRIQLFVANRCRKTGYRWCREKQDFEANQKGPEYIDKLKDVGVEIVRLDLFAQYPPNFQSDFFRWWILKENGGFYLDTDQIVLRSFETLPLTSDIIYSQYKNPQCGDYAPVGVVGACKGSQTVDFVYKMISKYYNANDYNSIGPRMFLDVIRQKKIVNGFNAPYHYFYPAFHSDLVKEAYSGKLKIPSDSYAFHWFGGHPLSQEFNEKYTEKFAQTSNDTISESLRSMKVI